MTKNNIWSGAFAICYEAQFATKRFMSPKVKSNTIQKSVVYWAISRWNYLPVYIVQENSKDRFNVFLNLNIKIQEEL